MQRQIRGHDLQVEVGMDEVVDAATDEEDPQEVSQDGFDGPHVGASAGSASEARIFRVPENVCRPCITLRLSKNATSPRSHGISNINSSANLTATSTPAGSRGVPSPNVMAFEGSL